MQPANRQTWMKCLWFFLFTGSAILSLAMFIFTFWVRSCSPEVWAVTFTIGQRWFWVEPDSWDVFTPFPPQRSSHGIYILTVANWHNSEPLNVFYDDLHVVDINWLSTVSWRRLGLSGWQGQMRTSLAKDGSAQRISFGLVHTAQWGYSNPMPYCVYELPFGPVLLVTSLLPLVHVGQIGHYFGIRLLRKKRRRNRQCVQCGYDLRATPAQCPECGQQEKRRSYGDSI